MEAATGQWERSALAARAPFPGLLSLTWAARLTLTLFYELFGVLGVAPAMVLAMLSSVLSSKGAGEEGASVTADCVLGGSKGLAPRAFDSSFILISTLV